MRFPTVVLVDGTSRVSFADREEFSKLVEVKLSPESILTTPGFALRQIASLVYKFEGDWDRVADSSNLRYPMDWSIGDSIKVTGADVIVSSRDATVGKPVIERNY